MTDNSQLPITDKLVEFAQKTVIQEQMTDSMNSVINNMRIPGAGNPMNDLAGFSQKKLSEQEGNQNES